MHKFFYPLISLCVLNFSSHGAVTVVDVPVANHATANSFYVGNRAPLKASPFVKLPVGLVQPRGWVRRQLELQSAGFHGHLGEISRFLGKGSNAWLNAQGQGEYGWEEVPYWLKGFGDCAYLLGQSNQIKEARLWIEGALASQRPDGFFGPQPGTKSTVSSTSGKYDLWPNMVMLFCLQSYYEFSSDPRVIAFMTRYFLWELGVTDADFLPPFWQQQRAADNLVSVYWLYNRTGEKWLLELASKIHRHTANWTDGIPNWHNVNMAQAFGGPTTYWIQSQEPKHLEASERNWQTIRRLYGQVPGGMFGGDENCRPGYTDPRQAIETCGMVEMMLSEERLLTLTGNPIWADRCEDIAFNSLPAALTADFKALRYLTAPNLAVSDRGNKAPGLENEGPMFLLDPNSHRCCQHNFGHGWPYLAEHLWLATPGNGLAAVLYGPSVVKAKVGPGTEVEITESTVYPFEGMVRFALHCSGEVAFPLFLRVPGWCRNAVLTINGRAEEAPARPDSYLCVDRTWKDGDTVALTLPMHLSLRTWIENKNSISIDRGPLTYSLKIGENYRRQGGTDKWPAWEILPSTPWNYGLLLKPGPVAASFKVRTRDWPTNDMPFTQEGVPVELIAEGKRIPAWQLDRYGLVAPLPASPVSPNEPTETLTLIPMGAARLRITSFPVIGEETPPQK